MKKKQLLNRQRHTHKAIRTDQNRQMLTDRTQMIALTPKEVAATVHTLQTAIVAEVTVTLELFDLSQDLTRLTRCMTHCSHAILYTNQVSEPRK